MKTLKIEKSYSPNLQPYPKIQTQFVAITDRKSEWEGKGISKYANKSSFEQ